MFALFYVIFLEQMCLRYFMVLSRADMFRLFMAPYNMSTLLGYFFLANRFSLLYVFLWECVRSSASNVCETCLEARATWITKDTRLS